MKTLLVLGLLVLAMLPANAALAMDIVIALDAEKDFNLIAGNAESILLSVTRGGKAAPGVRFRVSCSGAGSIPLPVPHLRVGELKSGIRPAQLTSDEDGVVFFRLESAQADAFKTATVSISCLDSSWSESLQAHIYPPASDETLQYSWESHPLNGGPDSVLSLVVKHSDGRAVQFEEGLTVDWSSPDGLDFFLGTRSCASILKNDGRFSTVVRGSAASGRVSVTVSYPVEEVLIPLCSLEHQY